LLTFGWIFLLAGLAGFFLPFLQGILFTLIGIYLLSKGSARARLLRQRLRSWLKKRYPDKMEHVEQWESKAKAWLHARTDAIRGWFYRRRGRT